MRLKNCDSVILLWFFVFWGFFGGISRHSKQVFYYQGQGKRDLLYLVYKKQKTVLNISISLWQSCLKVGTVRL